MCYGLLAKNPLAAHPSLFFRCAGLPVWPAEMYLAEPAIAPFENALWPESCTAHPMKKTPWQNYDARLTFFFAWSFSSAAVIPETQPY